MKTTAKTPAPSVPRRTVLTAALALPFLAAGFPARADNWPDKPIKLLVPFAAGGNIDVNGRLMAARLSEVLGQQMIVENRVGGSGIIATEAVARSAPDGYTLLWASTNVMSIVPNTTKTPYDPINDFAPITTTTKTISVLAVLAPTGPQSVKELIAKAKAAPGKLNYGAGITITRLAGATFAKAAGIDVVLIPYKGSAEVVQGLLTGSVDFIVDGVAPSLPPITSGRGPVAVISRRAAIAKASETMKAMFCFSNTMPSSTAMMPSASVVMPTPLWDQIFKPMVGAQRWIAAGLFDFSAAPVTMKPGQTARKTLVFPAGTYWRTTAMFSGAPQLVLHPGESSVATAVSSSTSDRVVAHEGAKPEHGSVDGVAEAPRATQPTPPPAMSVRWRRRCGRTWGTSRRSPGTASRMPCGLRGLGRTGAVMRSARAGRRRAKGVAPAPW